MLKKKKLFTETGEDVQLQPIGQDNTKDVKRKFNSNELSTGSMLGGLGSPDRDNSIQNTSANSINQTSYNYQYQLSSIKPGQTYRKSSKRDFEPSTAEPHPKQPKRLQQQWT